MLILTRPRTNWEPPKEKLKRFAPVIEGTADDLIVRDEATGQIALMQKTIDLPNITDAKLFALHLRHKGHFLHPHAAQRPRASGIMAVEQWFGWLPPDHLKKRYAIQRPNLYYKNPELAQMIEDMSPALWNEIKSTAPEEARKHEEVVRSKIHADWLIAGTPFSSGIINHTNTLPYHKDGGNLGDTWSMMLCVRDKAAGGSLDIPEFGVTLAVPNYSLIFFNGAATWHGVTPVTITEKNAYRFTLVWYVKQSITHAVAKEDEPHRAAIAATVAALRPRTATTETDD